MSTVVSIFIIASPLLFAMLAALISEYTGTTALFIEGIMTLSAFCFTACTILVGSRTFGFLLAGTIIVVIILLAALFTRHSGANPFLVALSINLFSEAIISVLSTRYFNGATVIVLPKNAFIALSNRGASILYVLLAFASAVAVYLFIRYTRTGLNLYHTASAEHVLQARGVDTAKLKTLSWLFAAAFSFFGGVALVTHLDSYTAHISGGRGWLGIAAIYLAKRHPLACIPIAFIIALSEYLAYNLQVGQTIPQSVLLNLPNLIALAILVISSLFGKIKIRKLF